MAKLSIRVWIGNTAAVFSGRRGVVARQAEQAGCSRQTVYQHARKLERRLGGECDVDAASDLRVEVQRLRAEAAELRGAARDLVRIDKARQRRLAVSAFAMGVSLRQIEDLLGVLLPPEAVPDHSTLGRWVQDAGERAGAALEVLDPACAPRVETLAVDEVFFGGGRPWSGSNRRA
jgi:hypothetical protein